MPIRPELIAALLACAAVGSVPAATFAADYQPTVLTLRDGTSFNAEKSSFDVPEDRGDPRSRTIKLGFVRLKATTPNPGPPIIYLAGGPGGTATGAFEGPRQPIFLALRTVADVILFDQRGTGLSNSIEPCRASEPLDTATPLTEAGMTQAFATAMNYCLARWKAAGVATNGYTTVASADDLEDLRKTLGATKIDLWGISYGSHLALTAMRRHPKSIRRVALASVEGLDQTVKRPDRTDAALKRIDAAVGGGLVDTMRRVHAKFDAAPQTLSGTDRDGKAFSFTTDSFALRRMASFLPKNPDGIPTLFGGYQMLDAGNGGQVAPFIHAFFFGQPLVLSGMPELMDLASGISVERAAQVERDAPRSLLGRGANFPMPQLAGSVPGLDLGADFRREIKSAIPTLVLSGDLDVRTPLEEQAEAIAGLTNAHQVVVRNGGHDLFEAHPAVPQLLIDFFSMKPIETRELSLPQPKTKP